MMKVKELISKKQLQYRIFIILSLAVAALTGILYFVNPSTFQRLFGKINPLVVVFVTTILGIVLFSFLLLKTRFVIYKRKNIRGLLISSALAMPFAILIILVDYAVVFPTNLSISLFPQSLLFYPAMGYVAEIIFQLLPLCLVFYLLTKFFTNIGYGTAVFISILFASLAEPIYQIIPFAGQYPTWVVAFVGVHFFFVIFIQLLIFKRNDFLAMYLFRLVYYLLWHIVWGSMRLHILF